jgi:hypothetical protein
VAVIITDVSEEGVSFIRKVKRISELILFTLLMKVTHSSETSVLTRAIRRHIPEDGILRSLHSENIQSYVALIGWVL